MTNTQRISRADNAARFAALDSKMVMYVYSGRLGCACGCRGRYSYASTSRELASMERGYEVTEDEVSNSTVGMMTNKIKRMAAEFFEDPPRGIVVNVNDDDATDMFSLETETRLYIIKLAPKSGRIAQDLQGVWTLGYYDASTVPGNYPLYRSAQASTKRALVAIAKRRGVRYVQYGNEFNAPLVRIEGR